MLLRAYTYFLSILVEAVFLRIIYPCVIKRISVHITAAWVAIWGRRPVDVGLIWNIDSCVQDDER
jgi:hypothetical protein